MTIYFNISIHVTSIFN